jgi:hypothetical protein
MPVAKLSREFYEKFGDKLADELVNCLNSIETSYRAELKELFEVHFARFEEKLERRLGDTRAELRTEFREEIGRLRVEVHAVKAELIKWTFVFWVPVALAVIGLYLKT